MTHYIFRRLGFDQCPKVGCEGVPARSPGHMFRAASPYIRHGEAMFANSKRVALVWLDIRAAFVGPMRPSCRLAAQKLIRSRWCGLTSDLRK